MPVILERLPPLISHLCCVFIGLLLSYYLAGDKEKKECFLAGKLFVAFPQNFLSKDTLIPVPGRKVHFSVSQSGSQCLIKETNAIVLQNEPFVVTAFPMKSANLLTELLNPKHKGHLNLVPENRLDSLKPCSQTQIKYGYTH